MQLRPTGSRETVIKIYIRVFRQKKTRRKGEISGNSIQVSKATVGMCSREKDRLG